jgi:CrcB protein
LFSGEVRAIILVGFMGSFTTFSTLIFESDQLLRDSQYLLAGLNVVGQIVLGFAALYAGMVLAKIF